MIEWMLVPEEPTEEMLKAANQHVWFYDSNEFDLSADQRAEAALCWRAMLAAAPKPSIENYGFQAGIPIKG